MRAVVEGEMLLGYSSEYSKRDVMLWLAVDKIHGSFVPASSNMTSQDKEQMHVQWKQRVQVKRHKESEMSRSKWNQTLGFKRATEGAAYSCSSESSQERCLKVWFEQTVQNLSIHLSVSHIQKRSNQHQGLPPARRRKVHISISLLW